MHFRQRVLRKGFALPTVLIASIVLLSILAVSVSATTAVRTTLKNQYYAQLAQVAGEAGVAYAKACLAANSNVPQWTNAKPLTPATDCAGNQLLVPAVQVLIVAGGGGGGSRHAGGGGGGGLIYDPDTSIAVGTYPVVVGNGGNGTPNGATPNNNVATNGGNSSIFGLTAIGGGAGRGDTVGAAGGSGGGGGPNNNAGGSGTSGQGYAGGSGLYSTYWMGGGGGGAGGAGTNASYPSSPESAGGPGVSNSITGAAVTYAAGGKGSSYNLNTVGIAGAANTGNGGGAGGGESNGGAVGGSGVVIISYPVASGITATGGTITTAGLYKVHRFTSNTNFVVTSVGTASCPTDPRCSVTINGNVRSSFSVGIPTLDSDGRALTIPYSGYVELTRTSNGAIWRTITQPSVQAAVVPDLCSAATTSALGWSNAVKAATQDAFNPTPSAHTITRANSSLNAGYMFFRKDFTVTKAGTYNVSALTPTTSDLVEIFIDGVKSISSVGSLVSGTVDLTPGCHTIVAKLTNGTIVPRTTRFTASVQKNDDITPVVATNSSWRVTDGDTKHYSTTGYYANTFLWTPVRVYSDPVWSENYSARNISTTHSYDGSNNYPVSYAYFRDNRTITVASATEARVAVLCDDACVVYLDGEQIILTGNLTNRSYVDVTLQPGSHKFGVRLQNTGGPAHFNFSVFKKSDNSVLSQSDINWSAANFWTTSQEFYSYDTTYVSSPAAVPTANARILAVGGGGGGGGNHGGGGGGGGVAFVDPIALSLQSYNVTVGAGGAGGTGSSGTAGAVGGASVFGDNLVYALGGGGGGGRITTNSVSRPLVGGSGGGGAGTIDAATGVAGAGTWGFIGQGNRGGNGSSDATAGQGGGGGGASSAGGNASGAANTGVSGSGGAGYTTSISGASVCYAGGGSGGRWGNIANGIGVPGCGAGSGTAGGPITGGAGTANRGGGGGGGSDGAGNGGAGGSGVVVISYPTGTMTATGGTITTSGGYTIHSFTNSSTFTVTAIPIPVTLGINVAPPFSQWTLSGGATYNSGTGEVTLPTSSAVVSSPRIRVDTLGVMYIGADFNPPVAAVNWTPLGGFYTQGNYYAIDSVTPTTSSTGVTANGCAKSLPLNVFTTNTTECGFSGGPNIKYVNFSFNGGDWASAGIKIKNPSIIFN